MNTPLLQNLRAHLASISKDQFKKEWSEIKAMGLDGPSMEEFIHSISLNVTVVEIDAIESVGSSFELENVSVNENNYSLAA